MNDLYAITTYYNPCGYKTRKQNYELFRQNILNGDIHLLTVEWSTNGNFVLEKKFDNETIIQVGGGDVMWQKERLMNIGLDNLPAECDKVVWVDCDILFENPFWTEDIRQALSQYNVVQIYNKAVLLHKNQTDIYIDNFANNRVCVAYYQHFKKQICGYGCAFRREVLQYGFYDKCIIGSADQVILCGAVNRKPVSMNYMSKEHKDDCLDWCKKFHQLCDGKVSYIKNRIYHLWHGNLRHRKYEQRHTILEKHHYNPKEDLFIDNRLFYWSTPKYQMHKKILRYFSERKEDS